VCRCWPPPRTANARVTRGCGRAVGHGEAGEGPGATWGRWTGKRPAVGGCWSCRTRHTGWHGWGRRLGDLPGSGIIYTLTVAAGGGRVAAFLRQRGYPVSSYTGERRRNADRLRAEEDLLANRGEGAGGDLRRWGWAFDKPDLGGSWCTWARPRPRSPTTSRWGVAGRGRWTTRMCCCCRGREDEGDLGVLRFSGLPGPREQVRRTLAALEGGGFARCHYRRWSRWWTFGRSKAGDDAQGSGRGRGRSSG